MLSLTQKGDYDKTMSWLKRIRFNYLMNKLDKYGEMGVNALSLATPKDTGKTSESWSYKIVQTPQMIQIHWTNSNRVNDVPIAIILQYGHGTGNGGYVQGTDYINPVVQPIFKQIEEDIWKEITKL